MKTISLLLTLSFFPLLSCTVDQDKILTKIFEGEKIVIDSLPGGHLTLKRSGGFFYDVYINSEYGNFESEQAVSGITEVGIYELKKDVNFSQIFESFNVNLNNLCFTQSQIVVFCKNNSDYLEGFATFFLFKENEHFFIAKVLVKLGRKSVYVHRLEDEYIWKAGRSFHVAVPI